MRPAIAAFFPIIDVAGAVVSSHWRWPARACGASFAAGAASIAVIGDLFTGGDPEARRRAFLRQSSRT